MKRTIAILLLSTALAAGCSDDPAGPGSDPLTGGQPVVWTQLRGGLGVGEIRSIWGSSPQNLVAAHASGILRYGGGAWRADAVPASLPDLNTVWGPAQGAPFAGGDGGTLLRWTGSRWSAMTSPTTRDIRDVHGRSSSDVYAVAATPTSDAVAELLHFDGTQWSSIASRNGVDGNAVFAVPGMVFVVCNAGVVLRHDGTTLYEDDTLITEDLHDVWARSANDAYAVGDAGRIIHWDGSTWSPMASGVALRLRAVSGTSSIDVDACGDGGVMLHFNGTTWLSTPTGTAASLSSTWVFPGGQRAAAGVFGTVLIGSGAQWAPRNLGQPFALEAVWSSSEYYMAVGTGPAGGVARDRDGFGWTFPEGLHAVSGFSASQIHAVGDGGAIYRFDGLAWEKQSSPTSSTLRGLAALVSRFGDPFRIYAAGDDGALLVWKSGEWNVAIPPAGAENHQFVEVWAAAIDDVFAVACNATSVVRYDDPYETAGWTLEDTPATSPLIAVGGWRTDTYIASQTGEIFFSNGNGWKALASPVTTPIRDIRALSETSLFAVGDAGVILRFDGTSWRTTGAPFAGDLLGLWGAADRPVFAVGSEGAVLVYRD